MKKLLSVITVMTMLVSAIPQTVLGADAEFPPIAASGQLTATVGYTFDEATGTVTITGEGDMPNYSGNSDDSRPWDNKSYGEGDNRVTDTRVKKVVIEEGITSIGTGAFGDMPGLTHVTIPASVKVFGDRAFQSSYMILSMSFAKDSQLTYMGWDALGWSQQFTYLTIPENVTSIGSSLITGQASMKKIVIPGENTPLPADFIFPAGCKFYVRENSPAHNTVVQKEWPYELIIAGGYTGDKNYQWYITKDGELNVMGYEDMRDYSEADPAPWAAYSNVITSIAFCETNFLYPGSSIGANAFSGLTNATTLNLKSKQLTEIGEGAFSGAPISEVVIPEKITSVGNGAFDSAEVLVARGKDTVVGENVVGENTAVYCYPDSTWKTANPNANDIKTFKVLGIGNSFTYDATQYLYNIATDALGDEAVYTDVIVGRAYRGGEDIFGHWWLINGAEDKSIATWTYNTLSSFGVTSATVYIDEALADQAWDYVWFQGYYNTNPELPSRNEVVDSYGNNDEALIGIVDYVKAKLPNAKTAYYLVWPRNYDFIDNDPNNLNNVSTSAELYEKLVAKTNQVMELTGADGEKLFDYMIPIGTAIENARTSALNNINYEPDATTKYTNLQRDSVHLNPVGQTIASMTIFKTLTGKSIDNITFKPQNEYLDLYLDMAKESANNACAVPTTVTLSELTEAPSEVEEAEYNLDTLQSYINNGDDVLVPYQAAEDVKLEKVTKYVKEKEIEDPDEILGGVELDYSVAYDEVQQQYYIITNVGYQTVKRYFDVNIVEDVDPQIVALDKAMELVVDGVAPLQANPSWESNSSTQEERTAAVQKYVDDYLVGDLESLTAEVVYNNGAYDVTFTNVNGVTKTKTLSDMELVYTLEAAGEDFDGYTQMSEFADKFFIDKPWESRYNAGTGELSIQSQTHIRNQVLGSPGGLAFSDGSINRSYIYEMRFKVNSFLNPDTIDETHYSAGTYIGNGLYEVFFTLEKDGIYYKDRTNGLTKLERDVDNQYHTYKVVARENGAVSLFIDSIKVLDYNAPMIETAATANSDSLTFGYRNGDKETTVENSKYGSMTVDYFNIKNIYEDEVFRLDTSIAPAYDGRNSLFGFTPDTISVLDYSEGAYKFKGWQASANSYIYIKLPKNAYITNIKSLGTETAYYANVTNADYHIKVGKFGLGNDWTAPTSTPNQTIKKTVMWTNTWGNRFTLVDRAAIEAKEYNMAIISILPAHLKNGSTTEYCQKTVLQDLEIEYKYFYDTEDEIIIADDMQYQKVMAYQDGAVTGEYYQSPGVPGYYGYGSVTTNPNLGHDWSFDDNYFSIKSYDLADTVEWYGNTGNRWDIRPERVIGSYFSDALALYSWGNPGHTVSVTKNNKPDFGPNYTYSAEYQFNKEMAIKTTVDGTHDFLAAIQNNGYKLWFTPCVNESKIKYLEAMQFGDVMSEAYAYADIPFTIEDHAWYEFKAVVNGDQATIYVNDKEIVTYTLPTMSETDQDMMVLMSQSDTANTGHYKVAFRDILVTKPATAEEEPPVVEFIQGITAAGATDAYENGNVTVTFNENVVDSAFKAYIAVYDANDKLIAIDAEDIATTIDNTDVLTVPYTEGQKIKVFFWDSAMTPVLDMLSK